MQIFSARVLLAAVARPLIWVAGFSCFLNISYLAAPLYMMQVYDRVMRSQSVPTLLYLTIALAMAYVTLAILDGVRGQILAGVSDIVEATLAGELLHLATSPSERGRTRPGPAHIGRDLDVVRQFAAGTAVLAFIDLPFSPLYLAVLFRLHWSLGCFALCACALLLGLSITVERMARAPMAHAASVAGRAYQFGDAIARHADCASTMGLGATLAGHWRGLRAEMLSAQNEATRRAVILGAIAKFARLFTQSTILGVGAYLAIHHQVGAGAVFAGSLLLGRCLAPVEAVIGSWRATLSARHALNRICEVAAPKQEPAVILPAPAGELTAERASWTPAGVERPAVTEVSFRIEPGAVLAIVGPNAAGKSTLGRLLSGAVRPDTGVLRLDGSPFGTWDPAQLGRAIGYLPQEVSLFPGTIRDNIARFGEASDAQVIEAAQAALAHDMILRLPMGYQTRVEEGVGCLSGGQKQRVALARALLWDPPVLILDEPNASLDADGEAALFRCVIAARERRRTVVMITHSTALVRIADYVATMVGGRVMRIQPAREFLTRPATSAAAE